MHMADALISPVVGGAGWAATFGLAAYSARKIKVAADDTSVPMMGVGAAFVFAAQMINFTIPGTGSSGHLGGGLILAVLLGPHAAFLAMASILTVQALFFADAHRLRAGGAQILAALDHRLRLFERQDEEALGGREEDVPAGVQGCGCRRRVVPRSAAVVRHERAAARCARVRGDADVGAQDARGVRKVQRRRRRGPPHGGRKDRAGQGAGAGRRGGFRGWKGFGKVFALGGSHRWRPGVQPVKRTRLFPRARPDSNGRPTA
jgi:hypothetical protein